VRTLKTFNRLVLAFLDRAEQTLTGVILMVAVLFDLEGTLVQTFPEIVWPIHEFRRLAREKLIELGIPPQVFGETKAYTLMRNKAIEYVEANFSQKEAKIFHQKLDEFLEKYEMGSARSSKLFPDTVSTLQRLKALGYKMGLITNTSKKAMEYMLSLHGLGEYFNAVITREDVKRFKPEPEGIRLALKKLGEREFVLVGDTIYDATTAERAGGHSIIVNRNPSREMDFHADYIVHSLEEIVSIMEAIGESKQK